jgi:hypothetical protein
MIGKAPRTDYIELVPERDRRLIYPHATDKDKLILKGATNGPFKIRTNEGVVWLDEDITVTSADLDTGAMEAGKDYNLYACYDDGFLDIAYSLASTYPAGYTADNSVRAGGFHTLCANVGTISGHPLSGYLAGEILPASVWDLRHRARNLDNRGMVYDDLLQLWIQIYLASDDGNNGVQSVNGATILDTVDWNAFVERAGKVGLRMLTDWEFQIAARGTNEETNIAGSADPVTTGGHIDTASRRMISSIGLEDATGVMHQWLSDQSYRFDMAAANIGLTAAGATATVYHAASPGGNQVYLKFSTSGIPYLCSNMATGSVDVWITLGSNQKFIIKHDATANTGIPVYMNRAATEPNKLLINNTVHGKNVYVATNYDGAVVVQLVHDASAATNGVALYYDDGTDSRLEATFSNSANNTFDGAYFSPLFNYYNLPGAVGSLYKQGDYGDVKLLAGGPWLFGSLAGSRCRYAFYLRSITSSSISARFACESL